MIQEKTYQKLVDRADGNLGEQELHHTEQYEIGGARFAPIRRRGGDPVHQKSIICPEPALD